MGASKAGLPTPYTRGVDAVRQLARLPVVAALAALGVDELDCTGLLRLAEDLLGQAERDERFAVRSRGLDDARWRSLLDNRRRALT